MAEAKLNKNNTGNNPTAENNGSKEDIFNRIMTKFFARNSTTPSPNQSIDDTTKDLLRHYSKEEATNDQAATNQVKNEIKQKKEEVADVKENKANKIQAVGNLKRPTPNSDTSTSKSSSSSNRSARSQIRKASSLHVEPTQEIIVPHRVLPRSNLPSLVSSAPTSTSTSVENKKSPNRIVPSSPVSSAPTSTSTSVENKKSPNRIVPYRPFIPKDIQKSGPFNYELYRHYKKMADNAARDHKVFTIIGTFYAVRNALLRRGWLERFWDTQRPDLQKMSQHNLLLNARPKNEYEAAVISKLLQPYHSNFIWHPRYMPITRFDSVMPFKSRMTRNRDFDFTLKCGLVNIVRNSHWQFIAGRSELASPRSYRLYIPEESGEFMADYRFTGCTSLLAYIVDGQDGEVNSRFNETGTISHDCIKFAIKRVREKIRVYHHDDVDGFQPEILESTHWRTFFTDFHATARQGANFKMNQEVINLVMTCKHLLNQAKVIWPNVITDGYRNIWIMKPAGQSRGIGVTVMENNLGILDMAAKYKNNRYVVQKYLERPLLIYNTKFDIRQYFLVLMRGAAVQVWMYKMCYLKFSSQEFSLQNYHESVHLTNHFVQKNYANSKNRSSMLPNCNMWSSDEFKNHLRTIGQPTVWAEKIYPSMKKNIVAIVRATYDEGSVIEPNCFELFGADFMLTESMDSLLLEVNATPDMAHSTPVTRIICPQCLEDVVKVVVDGANNNRASTGQFEMIYEIILPRSLPHFKLGISGVTKPIQQHRPPPIVPRHIQVKRTSLDRSSSVRTPIAKTASKNINQSAIPFANEIRNQSVTVVAPVIEHIVKNSNFLRRRSGLRKYSLSPRFINTRNAKSSLPAPTNQNHNNNSSNNNKINKSAVIPVRKISTAAIPVKKNSYLNSTKRRSLLIQPRTNVTKEVERLMDLNHTIEQLLKSQLVVQVST